MSITVRIPTPLRALTGQQDVVVGDGSRLIECIEALDARYPGIKERLVDEAGQIRRFVNIYVNGEDVRFLQGLDTPLKAGDELLVLMAMSGG